MELAKRLHVEPLEALQAFYESQTCADLHDKSTGLYLYGDLYVADEYMLEKLEDAGYIAFDEVSGMWQKRNSVSALQGEICR